MDSKSLPLVSIVTPLFNNADDLAECIESVLAQTYQNWDYTIVNNCSTDGSGEIARRYAAKDPRIRVHDNHQFLRVVPNHNVALRQISPESKYCKMVFADDWIFPQCIEQMVAVAEEHHSVGIVGAYGLEEVGTHGLQEYEVVCGTALSSPPPLPSTPGLPYPSRLVSGRDVCRRYFLEGMQVFGTASSVLYCADLVRSRDPFYNEANLHADSEASVVLLKTCNFGFVHQILTFKRWRPGSLSMMTMDMQMDFGCRLHTLIAHGPDFLTREEFEACLDRSLAEYYNFLAVSLMRGRRDKKFWDYHKRKLTEAVRFSRTRLTGAILARLCRAVLNPYETTKKLREGRRPSVGEVASENVAGRRSPVDPMGSDRIKTRNPGRGAIRNPKE